MEREDYIPRYEYERLESEYRRLRRKYEETEAYKDDLERLVSKSRSPPLDCGFVVEKLEDSAIVNLNGALKALPYGTLTDEEIEKLQEGKYVFIGRIPDRNNPSGFSIGITKMYDRMVDLEVGEIEELIKREDADGWVAEISIGKGRGRLYKRLGEEERKRMKEGTKVGLLPGTFDIKRSYTAKEYSRYEVTKSPGASFNDIGGLTEVKQELIKSIILPMVNPDDYSKFGESSRRILMYGPPGCGKTMCAKALASALPNCEFVKVGAGELFSMWLGESEKNVRLVFKAANDKLEEGENDYGVLFFDEIDICSWDSLLMGKAFFDKLGQRSSSYFKKLTSFFECKNFHLFSPLIFYVDLILVRAIHIGSFSFFDFSNRVIQDNKFFKLFLYLFC